MTNRMEWNPFLLVLLSTSEQKSLPSAFMLKAVGYRMLRIITSPSGFLGFVAEAEIL